MLMLEDLLTVPLLAGATSLAARHHAARRPVRWFSVIEWPVEDFVQVDDVVLTTGTGCDEERLVKLFKLILEARPAGILYAPNPSSPIAPAPAAARAAAERAEIPLIQIPWDVRFAEIARIVAERVMRNTAPAVAPTDALASEYVSALLDEGGMDAIVRTGEAQIRAPMVAFSSELRAEAVGPAARSELGPMLDRAGDLIAQMSATAILALRNTLERDGGQETVLQRLGLPPGTLISAQSARRTVGYVYAATSPEGPAAETVRQAAQAVALEQVRARAVAEAEVRSQGDLLWAIARGDITDADDISRRTALVGHSPLVTYQVAVGLPSSGVSASNDEVTLDAVTLPSLRRQGAHATRSREGVLVLAPVRGPKLDVILSDAPGATWGISELTTNVATLRNAYVRAHDTAVAAIASGAHGTVNHEHALGPYLLLTRIREDDATQRTVQSLLGAVLAYDESTGRNLLQTLSVYLASNGNASSAARDLHLNRHSLLYRIRKVQELTGLDLDQHEHRFLLDLALHLWRMEQRS